jgi:hypothetical protein
LVPSVTMTVRVELVFAALSQMTATITAQIHEANFFILVKGYLQKRQVYTGRHSVITRWICRSRRAALQQVRNRALAVTEPLEHIYGMLADRGRHFGLYFVHAL